MHIMNKLVQLGADINVTDYVSGPLYIIMSTDYIDGHCRLTLLSYGIVMFEQSILL